MPTELQLRDALSARADTIDDGIEIATLLAVNAATTGGRRRRSLLPVLAVIGSAVAVAVVAVVVVVSSSGTGHRIANVPSPHPAVAVTTTTRVGPAVSLVPGVVDAIALTTGYESIYDMRTDVEFVTVQMPGSRHASVAAYAASSGFDRSRVHGAVPVIVSGTAGWFGAVSDWPANGRPDPTTGKQDGALPSVVWQLPSGRWVLVQSDDPSRRTAAGLVGLADSLGVTDSAAPTRVPFVAGDLPAGLVLTGVGRTATGDAIRNIDVALTDSSGRTIDIDVGDPLLPDPIDPASFPIASRPTGSRTVSVGGQGETQQTVDRVLTGVTVVSDPTRLSDSWPTLQQALG